MSRTWTDSDLVTAVQQSTNMTAVVVRLGLRPAGGNYVSLTKHMARLGLKGDFVRYIPPRRKSVGQEALKKGNRLKGEVLKRLLRESGIKEVCLECGNTGSHNGKPLTLQVDHFDGDPTNNERSNLRFLCPNCHTQTPTYARRKYWKEDWKEESHLVRLMVRETCGGCGGEFMMKSGRRKHLLRRGRTIFFCSHKCGVKQKDIPTQVLMEAYGRLQSYSAVGREYGLSDVSVRKRIIRESSSGRTTPFEGEKDGSNPSSRTI